MVPGSGRDQTKGRKMAGLLDQSGPSKMEGERILKCVIQDLHTEDLTSDLKDYLHPLLMSKRQRVTNDVPKYQSFAMKLLKVIIQKLPQSSHPLRLLNIAMVCVTSLQTSAEHYSFDPAKIQSFSFEKLLLNLANQAGKLLAIDTVRKCFNVVYERLRHVEKSKDVEILLTGLADVLWEAANRVEKQKTSKPTEVLELRHHSIEAIVVLPSQFQKVLKEAIKTDSQLLKINGNNEQVYSMLSQFHRSLLTNDHLLEILDHPTNCQLFSYIMDWLIPASRSGIKLKDSTDIEMYSERIQNTVQSHYKKCPIKTHFLYDLLVWIHQFITSTCLTHKPSSLHLLPSLLSHINVTSLSIPHVLLLVESIQFAMIIVRDILNSTKVMSFPEVFHPLRDLLLLYTECLEVYMKTTTIASVILSAQSRQLFGISLIAEILLNLLLNSSSHCCSELTSECLPLLQMSYDILVSISLIPVEEHHSLGVNAYNLGQVLCQSNNYSEAVPILQLACEEFHYYCQHNGENVWHTIQKVKLYRIYTLLVETLLKVGKYEVAMETVKNMMMSLPTNGTVDQEQIATCMSQFVRIKCVARTKINDHSDHLLLTRSSCDWLTSCHDNNIKSLCLQEELKSYELMQQDTRAWQLTVAKQLSHLYPRKSHNFCWILIKQASLHFSLQPSDGQSSFDLLSNAVTILKSFGKNNCAEKKCMTFDLLGSAYLWKGIYLHSSHIRDSDTTANSEQITCALSSAVEYWCNVWEIIVGTKSICHQKCFLDYSSTLHHLLLFTSFSNALLLSHLTLKIINLLLSLSQWSTTSNSSVILYQALAMKTQVLLSEYGVESITSEHRSQLEIVSMDYVQGEEKLCVAQLECKLGLTALYIQSGEMDEALDLLLQILSHPVLSLSKSCVQHLLSSCVSVTSLYLQCLGRTPTTDMEEFLIFLIGRKGSSGCGIKVCPCKEVMSDSKSFKLTDLELALDSLKLTRGLMHNLVSTFSTHPPLKVKANDIIILVAEEQSSALIGNGIASSPVYKAWKIISCMMVSLLRVSRLYLAHGMVKESEHYTNEGLELAKKLYLSSWHVEFLIHLAEIKMIATDTSSTLDCIVRARTLLGLQELTSGTTSSVDLTVHMERLSLNNDESPSPSHSLLTIALLLATCQYWLLAGDPLRCLCLLDNTTALLKDYPTKMTGKHNEIILPYVLDTLQLRVRSLIATDRLSEIQTIGRSKVLSTLQCWSHLPSLRLPLAKLHYHLSLAILLTLERTQSPLIERICEGISGTAKQEPAKKVTRKKTRGRRRARRITDSDDEEEEEERINHSIPNDLRPLLSHLFLACQYLTPSSMSTCLVRDVNQLLGLCLSIWRSDLAAHFLLLSSSVSLNQEASFWFGRKIMKENGERSSRTILNDVLSTISTLSSSSTSPLVHARLMLHPLPHPHPLAYTQYIVDSLPKDWVYCSLSLFERLCGRKVLLILRVKYGRESIVARQPIQTSSDSLSSNGVTSELVDEFNSVMSASIASVSLTDKKEWWVRRKELDKQLENLLLQLQSHWLLHWRLLLLPTPSSSSSSSSTLASLLCKCDIKGCDTWAELLVGGAKELSSRELHVVLQSLITDENNISEVMRAIRNVKSPSSSYPPPPLILSLSQSLQGLPLENTPLLRDQLVTRIPSLPFLSAHLFLQQAGGHTHVNPAQTYYVVNPSGDLKNTQKAFGSWFVKEKGWSGVIGRPPSTDEFVNGLKEHDTFIYCGHGKAREYLGKEQRLQELYTCATVLQMGCSSGKLETIGHLDPQGMALNFLISGCPFLVANLWDVTDQDIDRFCTSLVKNWLTEPAGTEKRTHIELLHNLTEARNSCRLKYLIGASPVVYGLPVYRQ